MRKVTQQIASAFNSHCKATVGNTMTDGQAVFLRGNKIVERRADGVYFTFAGWQTPTTKERIIGVTDANVFQSKGELIYNDKKIDADKWYKVEGGE